MKFLVEHGQGGGEKVGNVLDGFPCSPGHVLVGERHTAKMGREVFETD